MTRPLFALTMLVLAACGGETSSTAISRDPVSVRGWILDVKGAQRAENMDLEIARRTTLFQSTSVWVEGTEYASGGVAENGSFIVLDVPPGNPILGFNAPGAETGKVMMEGVPGTADVFIPDLILEPDGATVLDPKKIVVRLAANVDKPTPTGKTAKVAGYTVPIINAPISQMMDRRDYPNPPGYRPVATIR